MNRCVVCFCVLPYRIRPSCGPVLSVFTVSDEKCCLRWTRVVPWTIMDYDWMATGMATAAARHRR